MPQATKPIPTSQFTADQANRFSIRLPAQIEFSINTDIASMANLATIGELSQLRNAMQNVGFEACSALLSHARAVVENEPSRPVGLMTFGTVFPAPEPQDQPRESPAEFEWSPDRHRIREAATRFLESDADH